jgi:hypothetical protein
MANKRLISTGAAGSSADNFAPVLYTGNGGTQSISSLDFQPDWVWVKRRDSGVGNTAHLLFDSVRGAGERLSTNNTNQESTFTDEVTSFDNNGFTVGADVSINGSGGDIVAWCWKAGGAAVSGTGTSGITNVQVSANTDAGFSIVTYEGSGTAGATITHGLDSTPELFFIKRLTNSADWMAVAKIGSSYQRAKLNDTAAFSTSMSGATNGVDPTDTVITLGNSNSVNVDNNDFVAYCFHSVDGYQKVGSYSGNGNSTGPVVTLGFEPRFVMVKRTDGTAGNWFIFDNARSPSNERDDFLHPNLSAPETTNSAAYSVDFLSNGFQIKGNGDQINGNGGTHIYLAIA